MRLASAAFALALLVTPASAQTTGILGLNDFTVNGSFPGSTSCGTVITSSPLTFFTAGSPTSSACALFLDPCGCSSGTLAFSSSCHSLGFTSFDLGMCPIVTVPMTPAGPPGAYVLGPIPVPPGLRFGAQSVLLDSSCVVPFLFTQAYSVGTV